MVVIDRPRSYDWWEGCVVRVGVDWSKHNTQLYAITVSVHMALEGAYT